MKRKKYEQVTGFDVRQRFVFYELHEQHKKKSIDFWFLLREYFTLPSLYC